MEGDQSKKDQAVKIDGANRERKWDFMHSCWVYGDAVNKRTGWDLRFTS